MQFGDKVKAFPLDDSGPKVGSYIGPADEEGKDAIQVGSDIVGLAYREPPYDDAGPNGTYCTI